MFRYESFLAIVRDCTTVRERRHGQQAAGSGEQGALWAALPLAVPFIADAGRWATPLAARALEARATSLRRYVAPPLDDGPRRTPRHPRTIPCRILHFAFCIFCPFRAGR